MPSFTRELVLKLIILSIHVSHKRIAVALQKFCKPKVLQTHWRNMKRFSPLLAGIKKIIFCKMNPFVSKNCIQKLINTLFPYFLLFCSPQLSFFMLLEQFGENKKLNIDLRHAPVMAWEHVQEMVWGRHTEEGVGRNK